MRTWLEIDLQALDNNLQAFRNLTGTAVMAVLKSNAYGHSLPLVAASLRPDWIGVNSIEEASVVRGAGARAPLLVMGPVDPDDFSGLGDISDCTIVLSSAQDILRLPPGQRFHLKIDTGMSRLGHHGVKLDEIFGLLSSRQDLAWTGLMTHFANVEDVTDQSFALEQLRLFAAAKQSSLRAAGSRSLMFHSAASGAAILLPESRMDVVRVGISLYGLWPSRETRISAAALAAQGKISSDFSLKPALTWKARVAHLNTVGQGRPIGYGCTYRTVSDAVIAVIPAGYFEGYDRGLSSKSHVIIRGMRAPVVGRVCMNMIMADVTHIPGVTPGDEAVLLGTGGSETVSADDLAGWLGTINYEVVSRIEASLPRIPAKST